MIWIKLSILVFAVVAFVLMVRAEARHQQRIRDYIAYDSKGH